MTANPNPYEAWARLKRMEDEAKVARIAIENEILEHHWMDGIPLSGTSTLNGIKIAFGVNRKWDQEKLLNAHKCLNPTYLKIWPFNVEYKEVRAMSRTLEKQEPDFWAQVLAPALTITPKKAAFTLVEDDA